MDFLYNAIINIPLKKNTYIIFEYSFNSEYLDIPLVINLKIDDVLEKDFNIHLKKHNNIRHMFKLEYSITKINFYLYLFNNEIYNDDKMEYMKKIVFNTKKLNLIYFLLYKYMAYYYINTIKNTVNNVKLKMQIAALTLKLSENNNNKIDDLLNVDKDINKDVGDNLNSVNSNKENISKSDNEIYKKGLLITSNNISIYGHKKTLDVIEEDIEEIDLNTDLKNDFKNNSDNITKNYIISQINKKKSEFNTDLINNHITKFSEIVQNNENIVKDINNNSNRINNLSDKLKNNSDNITKNYNICRINKNKSEFNTDLINNHITKFSKIDQINKNIIKDINNSSNRIKNLSDESKNDSDNRYKLIQNNKKILNLLINLIVSI